MTLQNNILSGQRYAHRFINSARAMGLTRDKKWLNRLIDKNLVCYEDESGNTHQILPQYHNQFKEHLSELVDVFQRKFDNNWDIHIETVRRRFDERVRYYFTIHFIVHHEKITITNTREQSRELTDLVTIFQVAYNTSTNCTYTTRIKGTRLTMQEDEWRYGYMHSHMNTRGTANANISSVFSDSTFCIGTEELSELDIELSVDFDIEKYELMLYVVDSLISWESLEGGPYLKMADIVSEQSEVTRVAPNEMKMMRLYSKVKEHLPETLPFNFVYVNNRYQIKHDNKFKDFLRDLFTTQLFAHNQFVICKRGNDGRFYSCPGIKDVVNNRTITTILSDMIREGEMPFVYIQGKKIHFNIHHVEVKPVDFSEYGIYPKFLDYVSTKLESELYKACVRGSGINYISNSRNNVANNSRQNKISL